jgi:outer membrane protein insertion porin family
VSGSNLAINFKSVRTRSSRSRIARILVAFALLSGFSLLPISPALAQAAPEPQGAPATAAQLEASRLPLCQPQVINNRRIPKDGILARMSSHQGDPYDKTTVERDFNSLWNTGYFENVRIEGSLTPTCIQLVVIVSEKPTIREINYPGLNSVTQSDLQERFKKAKVGITMESQYDPTRIARAIVVIKDLLSEHGHQFATVTPVIKKIPPASVSITFNIKEGPTVKVGKIAFDGNSSLNDHTLRAAMVNLKPIGIPHSILFENLFARTFDASKMDEDVTRVQYAYQDRGWFKAVTGEPQTHVRDAGGLNIFTLRPSTGKRIDILIPIEEGDRYKLGGINFSGNKNISNIRALRAQFTQKDGEWFDRQLFSKGLENLRKAYGGQGYINMVARPIPRFDEAKKLIFWDIAVDEDKQFFVSRIEFSGNTITRDKVIRRELLLEEGQRYSSQLWDYSIQRLNQLQYFETLKAEQDSETRQNVDEGTVDLLLKLKEKGKNSIGVNGGISGLSGTFIGLNYETNNFLGLGETLSAVANIGDLSRNITFGFNEPYLRDKPISVGTEVFDRKTDFNPAKAYSIANNTSANLSNAQNSLLTNYNQSTKGFTVSLNEPLKHLWSNHGGTTHLGVTYGLQRASITTFNDNTRNVFQSLAFRSGVAGPNQLNGIVTSTIQPSFVYSSAGGRFPHSGREFAVSVQVAGAGGNVKYVSPVASIRQFFPMKGLKISPDGHNVLRLKMQLAHVNGFGGEVAPPTNRIYGGGENDLRGFDIRSSTPYTFIPVKVQFNLTNPDGSTVPRDPTQPALGNIQIPIPIYRLVSVGGDTQLTSNIEYAIPTGIPQATFAFFTDFGVTGDLQPSQLRQSVAGAAVLSSPLYGCPTFVNGACYGGQKVGFPIQLSTVPHTNFVPRMSNGAELQVILPIVNAPFRIYYAYNPLRLYRSLPQQLAVDNATLRGMFPDTGAGLFSYQQAIQFYGAAYQLREPRKTFRLTVGTTF